MIKNYFSDITDLFLQVKKEENIQIDKTAKEQIKQMLQKKINGNLNVQKGTQQSRLETSFLSTWKYQLLGIPASVFAFILVVFAVTNLNVSIKKENFTPVMESSQPAPAIEYDDKPLIKTAPKPRNNKIDTKLNDKTQKITIQPTIPLSAPIEILKNRNEELAEKPNYSLYTYTNPNLKSKSTFGEKNISKLIKSTTPDSVSVYYANDNQVVVEIENAGTTKWYLFKKIKGIWTISKYEKFPTKSVIKYEHEQKN